MDIHRSWKLPTFPQSWQPLWLSLALVAFRPSSSRRGKSIYREIQEYLGTGSNFWTFSNPPPPILASCDQAGLQLPSCNWIKVLVYLGPSCTGLLQSCWGRLGGYSWALVVYPEAWGQSSCDEKDSNSGWTAKGKVCCPGSGAVRSNVSLWKKESNNDMFMSEFWTSKSKPTSQFSGKDLVLCLCHLQPYRDGGCSKWSLQWQSLASTE